MSYLDLARRALHSRPDVGAVSQQSPCEISEKGEISLPAEVAWRLAIFRARISPRGPIYPPKLRNTPLTDTPGCCGLCGESLSPERRFRCVACVAALEIALSELREGVTVSPPAQRREEGAA